MPSKPRECLRRAPGAWRPGRRRRRPRCRRPRTSRCCCRATAGASLPRVLRWGRRYIWWRASRAVPVQRHDALHSPVLPAGVAAGGACSAWPVWVRLDARAAAPASTAVLCTSTVGPSHPSDLYATPAAATAAPCSTYRRQRACCAASAAPPLCSRQVGSSSTSRSSSAYEQQQQEQQPQCNEQQQQCNE